MDMVKTFHSNANEITALRYAVFRNAFIFVSIYYMEIKVLSYE